MSNDLNQEPVSSLIGKSSRVYSTGEMITEDYLPERVNIELSKSGEIVRIWMG
ncbi:I78 family peptidase inhibitor [Pseudoalteromonas carrageenovora]|uniref:I78 family peptidase inhibitor n=1 Tax=Pseudoalteromonas carrageenovora TaxID=227 RepID=UPI0026E147A3|nr:I78 family peptidase inhibitor [Pseudoalteromonas carrageenovora]MDO6547320.1 I78 family peptidase inhibitor [Pseudoalteromonas carrageenovora]MDO6831768.1 I78 family peptidase inhibitor [Pseudoalteromonas carrageenovora]